MYNMNVGYGQLLATLQHGGVKSFVVCKNSAPEYDRLSQIIKPDPDGVNRLHTDLDSAINAAAVGDVIFVAPGHTENVSTASDIVSDVDGVQILGLGEGDNKPVFTFDTATAAGIDFSGDGTAFKNIRCVAGIDGLTAPINVTGDNLDIDIEWFDGSSTVEAARIVRGVGSSNVKLKVKHVGFPAGNACVNTAKLTNCHNWRIELDAYGKCSAAWVEFATTACTNIDVTGRAYTSGTTDFSKLVVDTVTGSIWTAELFDAAAGTKVLGSNVNAFADASVAAVSSQLSQLPILVSKSNADMSSGFGTGDSPVAQFTVSGVVLARAFGAVSGNLTSASNNGTISLGTADDPDALIPAATADGTSLQDGDVWFDATSGTDIGALPDDGSWVVINSANIVLSVGTNNITAGAVDVYVQYIPITAGASVVAA